VVPLHEDSGSSLGTSPGTDKSLLLGGSGGDGTYLGITWGQNGDFPVAYYDIH
jgi:hypothetical protein